MATTNVVAQLKQEIMLAVNLHFAPYAVVDGNDQQLKISVYNFTTPLDLQSSNVYNDVIDATQEYGFDQQEVLNKMESLGYSLYTSSAKSASCTKVIGNKTLKINIVK